MSNLQRQREFRARNPHYYRDLHRKRKAAIDARLAAKKAEQATPAPGSQTQTPLALPASISEPLVTVQLPLFEQAPEPVEATRPQVTPAQVVEQLKRAA